LQDQLRHCQPAVREHQQVIAGFKMPPEWAAFFLDKR